MDTPLLTTLWSVAELVLLPVLFVVPAGFLRRGTGITRSYIAIGWWAFVYVVASLLSMISEAAAQAPPVGRGQPAFSYALIVGAEFVAVFGIVFGVILIIGTVPSIVFFNLRDQHKRPELSLTVGLLQLLTRLEENDPPWETFKAKQSYIRLLRYYSTDIERNIPRPLRSGFRQHDEWRAEVARQQAEYVRGLCRWLVLPMGFTRSEFSKEIAQVVRCILNDDWHHFPRTTTDKEGPAHAVSLRNRVAAAATSLRLLLVAALPILVFAVLHFLEHGTAPDWLQLRPDELPELVHGVYPYAKAAFLVAGIFRVAKLADPTLVRDLQELFDVKRVLQGPRADR